MLSRCSDMPAAGPGELSEQRNLVMHAERRKAMKHASEPCRYWCRDDSSSSMPMMRAT